MRLFRSLVNLLTASLKADNQNIDLEQILTQAQKSLESKSETKQKTEKVNLKQRKGGLPQEAENYLRSVKERLHKKYNFKGPLNYHVGNVINIKRKGSKPFRAGKSVKEFIKERCIYEKEALSSYDEIYWSYTLWCKSKKIDGKDVCSKKSFGRFLSPTSVKAVRMTCNKKCIRFYLGIKVKNEEPKNEEPTFTWVNPPLPTQKMITCC